MRIRIQKNIMEGLNMITPWTSFGSNAPIKQKEVRAINSHTGKVY